MWVGVVGESRDGEKFSGTFRFLETPEYQDHISTVILDCIRVVPNGVLCFVPSYGFLDKIINRMKQTGLYKEIDNIKKILVESKSCTSAEFGCVVADYEKTIKKGRGAMLFAVYRGKVSEGLDFKDNNARAVIAIGIPYPNVKDIHIQTKRNYNDLYVKEKLLLPGSEWYEIQAYRALNQALGRCIRHKNDWGAIVLLDYRFTHKKNKQYLSRWVRQNIQIFERYDETIMSLERFIMTNQSLSEITLQKPEIGNLPGIDVVKSPYFE